jgi:hydrogenase nickel incorporation protein HypB
MCRDCACGQPPPEATPACTPAPAESPRELLLQTSLLQRNDAEAAALRRRFQAAGVTVVNLLSSPGSGKTALLEALAGRLQAHADHPAERPDRLAVIVGDLATDNDARRLRAAGLRAAAITTGQACHLEVPMVEQGLHRLRHQGVALEQLELLVIENVGNLVCPGAYDLGEDLRVVLVSTTEGEDKPLKYAPIFHGADLVLITKIDLAEVVGFDRAAAHAAIARVAPRARVLETSARSGAGLDALIALLGLTTVPVPSPPTAAPAAAPAAASVLAP